MTETQLLEFREAFNQFDKDRSGFIDRSELKNLCEWVGQETNESDIEEMMALADGDGSGQIDFWEFATLMAHKMGNSNLDKSLASAFSVFDTNGDGTISAEEIRNVMREVGEDASDAEIQKVLGEIDEDGNGTVDYKEFSRVVTREMQDSGFQISF